MWQKAEEHYLRVESCDTAARQEALEGLARIPRPSPSPHPKGSLALGKQYEELGRWEEAERRFAEAAQGDDQASSEEAVEGVRRMREKVESERSRLDWLTAQFDWWAAAFGRLAALFLVVVAVVAIRSRWKSISVLISTTEEAPAQQIAYWFRHARAMLRAESKSSQLDLLHPPALVKSALPFIALPGLDEGDLELDDIEVGGVTVALSKLLNVLKPRVQISTDWSSSSQGAHAYAEIASRDWFVLVPRRVVSHSVTAPGQADECLELMIYDALIEAVEAYGS